MNELVWISCPTDESIFSTMTILCNTFEQISSEFEQILGLFYMASINLANIVKKLANVQNIGNLSIE
jgi:hypothetical protein